MAKYTAHLRPRGSSRHGQSDERRRSRSSSKISDPNFAANLASRFALVRLQRSHRSRMSTYGKSTRRRSKASAPPPECAPSGEEPKIVRHIAEGLQHFRVFEFAQFSTSLPRERDGSDICRIARHRFGTPDGSRCMVTLVGLRAAKALRYGQMVRRRSRSSRPPRRMPMCRELRRKHELSRILASDWACGSLRLTGACPNFHRPLYAAADRRSGWAAVLLPRCPSGATANWWKFLTC